MSAHISIHDRLEQLLSERLTSLSEGSIGIQSDTIDPKLLTALWLDKDSEFKFLEELSDLLNPMSARELLFLFKELNQLLVSVDEVREARAQDDVDPLPDHFYEATRSVEELDWVETLFEEELLEGDDSTLLTICLATARELKSLIIHSLCSRHQLKPVFHLQPREEDSAPSVESKWVGEQRLGALYPHYSEAWGALASQEKIQRAVDEVVLELQAELDELRASWLRRCEESEVSCDPIFWGAQLSPVAIRWATQHITTLLIRAISEDVADLFERLATSERPRDHRVGALVFGGERGEDVTVVFTKRDGHILAQRQVTWDPERPEEICDAFREIKIRTLVAPDVTEEHIERGLERLCERYLIARVSPVATVEVKRPHNLSDDAQVALQLAQRYVAPLRYWARADLLELARVSLEAPLFELLTRTPSGRALYESVLKGRVDLGWVRLRGLRQRRSDHSHESATQKTPPASPPTSSTEAPDKRGHTPAMRRGELVDVTLTEVSSFRLKGEVSEGPQRGRGILISLSGSRELIERSFVVGQRLRASVIHDHPKQPHAHLTLRALGGSGGERLQAQPTPKRSPNAHHRSASPQGRATPAKSKLNQPQRSDHETLQTLNALFKKSPR